MSDDEHGGERAEIMDKLGIEPEDMKNGAGDNEEAIFTLLSQYFPDSDSFDEKTNYRSENTPLFVAQAKIMADEYEDVIGGDRGSLVKEMIEKWLQQYQKNLPSIGGGSRQEFKDILEAFGRYSTSKKKEDESPKSFMKKMFKVSGDGSG